MNILYISYDGAADNLGQSQIVPYINGLSGENFSFVLLTYEKKTWVDGSRKLLSPAKAGLNEDINWVALRYHKRPSLIATLYDIACGFIIGLMIVKKKKIKLIHGRSFIGSVVAFLLKCITNVKVLLDIRGFWPEERVEAGIWKKGGWLFKITKYIEKILIHNADEIVVLTEAAKKDIGGRILAQGKNISVIPTCVHRNGNPKLSGTVFQSGTIEKNRFIISYIGSVSTWYMPEEMIKFFDVLKKFKENSLFLVLSNEVEVFKNILKPDTAEKSGIRLLSVEHRFVSAYLSLCKAGIAFYKPGYSRIACSPTKLGEYLLMGLPVIINSGIGDCDQIISGEGVGVVLKSFSEQEYESACRQLLTLYLDQGLTKRCMDTAEKYFSLKNIGISRYTDIYKRLMPLI